jgi:hypothetical protein
MNAKYNHRTKEIKVPKLSSFFGENEEPVWIVRGLEGAEIGACKQAASKDKSYTAILEAIKSENVSDKIAGVSAALDLGSNKKIGDIPERLHQLVAGSIEPKCTLDMAVKLSKIFPTIFYELSNEILLLSGQGMQLVGELEGSLSKQTS